MITERSGDLLEQTDLTHIAHQANLYHTFGAGLALAIARKFPEALEADKKTPFAENSKLGFYSQTDAAQHGGPVIVNLYSQRGFGAGSTHYIALEMALRALERSLRDQTAVRIGLPFKLGCGLAGGDWGRVRTIIEAVFAGSPIEVVICIRPEDAV